MAVFSLVSAGAKRASSAACQNGDHGNRTFAIRVLPGGAGGPGGPTPEPGPGSPARNPAARPGPQGKPPPPPLPPSPITAITETITATKATVIVETRSLTQVISTLPVTTTLVSSTTVISTEPVSFSASILYTTKVVTSLVPSTSTVGGEIPSAALGSSASPSATPLSDPMAAENEHAVNDRTLVITLSTVLSVVGLVVIAIGLYLCLRNRRRRLPPLFNRGITPIQDDEIATWKISRNTSEKSAGRYTARNSITRTSTAHTHKKAPSQTPSLIQYQQPIGKQSFDSIAQSPRSFIQRQSTDLPQSPPSAILAKAPNARTGLTDQTIPGDDPFLPGPKRQPSRLHKLPNSPPPTSGNFRTRSSRSNSMRSFGDAWYGDNMGPPRSPRVSSEAHSAITRTTSSRIYSTSTVPPRLSLSDHNEPLPFHRPFAPSSA
ncbi:histone deacetylase clr3 [Apiospora arundinis]